MMVALTLPFIFSPIAEHMERWLPEAATRRDTPLIAGVKRTREDSMVIIGL
jgi:hypothetical protein